MTMVYLAGPMAGMPGYNFKSFNAAAKSLRTRWGFQVVNPASLDEKLGMFADTDTESWSVAPDIRALYMARDLPFLLECDELALLPGWETSVGANMELAVARMVGMHVVKLIPPIWIRCESHAQPKWDLIAQHCREVEG